MSSMLFLMQDSYSYYFDLITKNLQMHIFFNQRVQQVIQFTLNNTKPNV